LSIECLSGPETRDLDSSLTRPGENEVTQRKVSRLVVTRLLGCSFTRRESPKYLFRSARAFEHSNHVRHRNCSRPGRDMSSVPLDSRGPEGGRSCQPVGSTNLLQLLGHFLSRLQAGRLYQRPWRLSKPGENIEDARTYSRKEVFSKSFFRKAWTDSAVTKLTRNWGGFVPGECHQTVRTAE
jgi:hypothetical protein